MIRGALIAMGAALLCVASAPRATAQDGETQLVQALSDTSFKVRLQAAILIGKKKLSKAAPALRRALSDESDAVRAAAALSLGKLGDEESRADLARLLTLGQLVGEAAEKGLKLMDNARTTPPKYLVVVQTPQLPQGVPTVKGHAISKWVVAKLRARTELVLTAGEEQLPPDRLKTHLEHRGLTGMALQPRLVKLEAKSKGSGIQLNCKISIMTTTWVQQRLEFAGDGLASAEVEGSLADSDREDIDAQLLEAASGAAAEQVIKYLGKRTGP